MLEAVPAAGFDPDDLDGVAPLAGGLAGRAELLSFGRGLPGPAVGADDQHVVRSAVGRRHAHRARAGGHLAPLVAEVPVPEARHHQQDHHHHDADPQDALGRTPPPLAGLAQLPPGGDGHLPAQDGPGEFRWRRWPGWGRCPEACRWSRARSYRSGGISWAVEGQRVARGYGYRFIGSVRHRTRRSCGHPGAGRLVCGSWSTDRPGTWSAGPVGGLLGGPGQFPTDRFQSGGTRGGGLEPGLVGAGSRLWGRIRLWWGPGPGPGQAVGRIRLWAGSGCGLDQAVGPDSGVGRHPRPVEPEGDPGREVDGGHRRAAERGGSPG